MQVPKRVLKWQPSGRRKRGGPKLTWAEGFRGTMGEKVLMEEDWTIQKQMEEEDYIIATWAQEDVKTMYNLLNKNNLFC